MRDLLLSSLEVLSHKVVRLHRRDRELYVVLGDFEGIERIQFGLISDTVSELAN